MKRILPTVLLTLLLPAALLAQPGNVRSELEQAVEKALVDNKLRGRHFYAKSRVERRWVTAFFNGHSSLTYITTDDAPRWYDIFYRRPSRGFYFDVKAGADLGELSMLDKGLAAAMRRAVIDPKEATVGMDDAVVTYYTVEHVPYDEADFNRWMARQRSIVVPWHHRNASDGTLSMAFVPSEQERAFRRHNDYGDYERFLALDYRPMAANLIDFDWFGKTNFLLETCGVTFNDSLFVEAPPTALANSVYVKYYDTLYVWENGFLRGRYPLVTLDSLDTSWDNTKRRFAALRSRGLREELVRGVRCLPFDERVREELLAHYEDSIYNVLHSQLDDSGTFDKAQLARYFLIYGKYEGKYARAVDSTLCRLASHSMDWVHYYLLTYDKTRSPHYALMDSLAFAIVERDFTKAQTYKDLFPNGRRLRDADEIITFEKACRLYDHNFYTTRYPDGAYHARFEKYLSKEEERLYQEAMRIYRLENRSDIEAVMHNAISAYRNHFATGKHIGEVNEMYYYGVAFQKKMANIYGSRYSMATNRGSRLRRLISQDGERQSQQDSGNRNLKQRHWLHKRLLSQPLSKYVEMEDLGDGSYKVTYIRIFLPGKKESSRCRYENKVSLVVHFDKSEGVFYIDEGEGRRYRSDSVFLTLRRYLTDGYTQNYGVLYEAEQWLLENCDDIPYNP